MKSLILDTKIFPFLNLKYAPLYSSFIISADFIKAFSNSFQLSF
jgi:hypothetical protein